MKILEILKTFNPDEWIIIGAFIVISFGLGWLFHSERNIPVIQSLIDEKLEKISNEANTLKSGIESVGASLKAEGLKLGDLVNNLNPAIEEAKKQKQDLEYDIQNLEDNGLIVKQNELQALYDELEKFGEKMIEDNSIIGQLKAKNNEAGAKKIVETTQQKLKGAKNAVDRSKGGGRPI